MKLGSSDTTSTRRKGALKDKIQHYSITTHSHSYKTEIMEKESFSSFVLHPSFKQQMT